MSLLQGLQWRHAAKAYDANRKISAGNLQTILDAVSLAPTSSGLQPYRVMVVEDQAIKNQLSEGSLNPECMKDCSHVLVFAAWDEYTNERIDKVYDYTTEERGLPKGRFDSYTNMLKNVYGQQTPEQHFQHAARQSYIALGFALAQAAELKIDSTPAEGFNNAHIDKVLGLAEKGLKSTVILYLGYSDDEKNWLKAMKKVRIPQEELVTTIL